VVRLLSVLAFLLAGQALAGECGPRIGQAQLEPLTQELQKGVLALAAYGEALASRSEANAAHQLVQQLTVLHERMGRVAQLAEIRDAMRHDGEKSFVRFKLSHEASLLKLVSSRARRGLEDLLLSQRGIAGPGPDRLRDAVSRTAALFAACDSPM
jgi:hypothetical protein